MFVLYVINDIYLNKVSISCRLYGTVVYYGRAIFANVIQKYVCKTTEKFPLLRRNPQGQNFCILITWF